ncbi:MAG: 3-isopropylmalate dehydratase large subunit [Pyrobaculum arsenaticum]|uniref:3-isopropylmalate dehydratase large subunit n=2 Tax=Pyrobaculum arsenaticum TaxID=121277 RepID=LEUC_PYRAR|nr:3-isopropylmalate dehydratase large subunit [Pyrobaculum arsenaticum]A4WMI6.1 RecName: Full=3-isopropylmalate dehydratase large subunit; AltName: Full=Alpha-IPM isomerase; Short=IPMI; AltName: Full=Isopropylmalate isomerase [Pyrobaculum arsenaticum DSM 13514]ABP51603.1 3-isopropylmalate dehydratase, large subunit [Pyrobaculum arsenaticum DSM 13514]MCY0891764.1 3-isopropylmalate dehydratase large subunit [Pyrobaculum arsenaticum]NYR16429.1 3-isopropylmalate dehydratase large subunit [Pyrobacu
MPTWTEHIFYKKTGRIPSPGDVVEVAPDLVGFHDLTGYHVLEVLEHMGKVEVFDNEKVVVAFDHLSPPPNQRAAEIMVYIRRHVKSLGLPHFFDVGGGILHQIILERYAMPGQVIFTADSHGNTAGAVGAFAHGMGATDIAAALKLGKTWLVVPAPFKVEVRGEFPPGVMGKDVALHLLGQFGAEGFNGYSVEVFVERPKVFPMDDRATVGNMSTEMGADALMFIPDAVTAEYLKTARGVDYTPPSLEPGNYADKYTVELGRLEPLVAAPHSVDNVKTVREVEGVEVDQVFIGSCTNGRLRDIATAARILKGRRVKTRCIAIPASYEVFKTAMKLGYIDVLTEAGCVVTYGTCGPCLGGHFGVAGPGEVHLTTSNRNFKGRVGHPEAKIYLANPAVAAATAAEGRIADPRPYLKH